MTHNLVEPVFTELRNAILEPGTSIKEAILKLWGERFSAKTIMDVLAIDESDLEEIIPRNLWFYDHWTICRKCGGRGGYSHTDQTKPLSAPSNEPSEATP